MELHGITKANVKQGGLKLNESDRLIHELKRKVEQHENTIVQLLEIIAATNCRIAELTSKRSLEG
ncbi:hypothetical protein SAMN05216389_11614 [Oceanobacillus limi]|uniref:Uncharacterized protein n=1 Tax=Oceanobacillus limi TaxID=930131 RepID=A0A1I0FKS4_9BACI|nr:hypothetical protein SAMN05216389_11614 [Oceanobacillus limi]